MSVHTIISKINLSPRHFFLLSSLAIIGFACIPLFINFPYRINIFLAWDGAYRISQGQIPFRDFGMPLGFGFWLIPALFFKLFGPFLITLVKAQAFINIIAGFTFLNILRILKLRPGIIFLSVLLFCLSFSFVNFWPWYNHMVFVYQLLSINFLLLSFFSSKTSVRAYFYVFLSAFFIFLSFFTKQDGGALAFLINFFLLLYYTFVEKNYKIISAYYIFLTAISCLIIVPLLQYNFSYWFNLGQAPHSSRIQLIDILDNIFVGSQWIKFYLLMIAILLISSFKNFKLFIIDKQKMLFTLLVLGILVQALIVQTTSYIPHNVNIYFHSFAFAFILTFLPFNVRVEKPIVSFSIVLLIFFWWSSDYWNYSKSLILKVLPERNAVENESVSINNWMTTVDTVKTSRDDWQIYDSKAFQNISMPPSTIAGIKYIKNLDVVKEKKEELKILNMSELTPLAYELNYKIEKGPSIPLWYHKSVAIFDPQIRDYCDKIEGGYYDVVLFEHINYLNNFYPEEVRECLKENYEMDYRFLAPREIQNSYIEVYLPKR